MRLRPSVCACVSSPVCPSECVGVCALAGVVGGAGGGGVSGGAGGGSAGRRTQPAPTSLEAHTSITPRNPHTRPAASGAGVALLVAQNGRRVQALRGCSSRRLADKSTCASGPNNGPDAPQNALRAPTRTVPACAARSRWRCVALVAALPAARFRVGPSATAASSLQYGGRAGRNRRKPKADERTDARLLVNVFPLGRFAYSRDHQNKQTSAAT